jgi:putative heme-binding domain-containing protein
MFDRFLRLLVLVSVLLLLSGREIPRIEKSVKGPTISMARHAQIVAFRNQAADEKEEQDDTQQKGSSKGESFVGLKIDASSVPEPKKASPRVTSLPLDFSEGEHVMLIGNTLLDYAQFQGFFETLLQQRFPSKKLVVRTLAWSADEVDVQPRPDSFGSLKQHLSVQKADLILAAYGFNESFAGPDGLAEFQRRLDTFLAELKSRAFNGTTSPRIVLLSPIASEDIEGVAAGEMNNHRIEIYTAAMKAAAARHEVGFVDLFGPTRVAYQQSEEALTRNGVHLNEQGYRAFATALYRGLFRESAPSFNEQLRQEVLEKNRQFHYRYRPVNSFYYVGGRSKRYGQLDFLPAMARLDVMIDNRDNRIWRLASGEEIPDAIDDSNAPPLPPAEESRGANKWLSPDDELAAFKVDPRFQVNCFASEEDFPELACPIQMRWDSHGRLWVSTSRTYPHVYPGNEPNDQLLILEDQDGDGKADRCSVFATGLHIPLSFEFGDGGVYVSEAPHLTFLKDTDGDGKADLRRRVLTGFGTEDSHHALHDIVWTPDGDLMARESIFHHSQVETPYGPIRLANSGWFRYRPSTHRLTTFGMYHSTNPWGVTFDDWGQHLASHPIFATAFHAVNPDYPIAHPRPAGLPAYSGVCGQEFVDMAHFPDELQGEYFIKVRYKPTNRVEIHKWVEHQNHYREEYQSDLIYSSNLSFIPVDLRYGPRGAMYVCDWYNPIKGHSQYSLRDSRRDRQSGRIWRITAVDRPLMEPPAIAGESVHDLLEILKRREYRYRYWAKRELRDMDPVAVRKALDRWVDALDKDDPRYRHHQLEAIWMYRNIDAVNTVLLREVLACEEHHARAAATRQLRYWHIHLPDVNQLLSRSANDGNGLVRLEAVIAASYIGTRAALDVLLEAANHPRDTHMDYALTCAIGSRDLRPLWNGNPDYSGVPRLLKMMKAKSEFVERKPNASQAEFDKQAGLKQIAISCVPERMRFTLTEFVVTPGQPIKLVFTNPDATDHNLVFVTPGSLEAVGMAANNMARDPKFANSNFIPAEEATKILRHTPMIGPTRKSKIHVLRFRAPRKPGVFPYVCTFPGHWIVMKGHMVVAETAADAKLLLAEARKDSRFVRDWKVDDLAKDVESLSGRSFEMGKRVFSMTRCHVCHSVNGNGVKLAPDLTEVAKKYKGIKLLEQVIAPSTELNEKFRTYQFLMRDGRVIAGTIFKDEPDAYQVIPNLLNPRLLLVVPKNQVDEKLPSKISSMPESLLNGLTREQILDLMAYLQAGGKAEDPVFK